MTKQSLKSLSIEPVEAKAFANLVLDWADAIGVRISQMKLQKLIYYCHADFLVETGKPLIDQNFEAWEFGPVIPSLYQEFKAFASAPVSTRAFRFNPVTCEREEVSAPNLGPFLPVVRASFDAYIKYTASALSSMSHSEQGPWAETLRRFKAGSTKGRSIENQVIKAHHRFPMTQSVH